MTESIVPSTGWRTARLDAHDTYMDTPYYERMQYIGDTRIQGRWGVLMTMSSQYGANTMEVTEGLEVALREMAPVFAKQGIKVYDRLHRPAIRTTRSVSRGAPFQKRCGGAAVRASSSSRCLARK